MTETLFRLIGRGEGFVDVGANVGFTSLVGAAAAGPLGTVLAIEPHPEIFPVLSANAACWAGSGRLAEVQCIQAAATEVGGGTGNLVEPEGFAANHGLASLRTEGGVSVPTVSLDDLNLAATVVKIDVEGHEAAVLRVAKRTILDFNGPVRDVIFEALDAAGAVEALSAAGFEVFGLSQGVLRPKLVHWSQPQVHWEAPMMLGTRDASRSQRLLGALGWRSLTGRLPRPC